MITALCLPQPRTVGKPSEAVRVNPCYVFCRRRSSTISPSSGKRPVACFENTRTPSATTSNTPRSPWMSSGLMPSS